MSIAKSFILWLVICIAATALSFSAKADEISPKFEVCMLATQHAMDSFRNKESKRKIKYTKIDDIFIAFLMKQAVDIGYKASSIENAAVESFASCVENKIWN